jgi:hypothetical protein
MVTSRRFARLASLTCALALLGPAAGYADPTPASETGTPTVVRAVFARAVQNREPVEVVSQLDSQSSEVFFFTELSGFAGKRVKHRWEFGGNVMGEVMFEVGAAHWRVYSSKRLLPGWTGTWTVSVVDESGHVLHRATLGYGLADRKSPDEPENEASDDEPTPAAPHP